MNIKNIDIFLDETLDDIYYKIRLKLIALIFKKKKYKKFIMDYSINHNKLNITLSSFQPNKNENYNIYMKIFTPFYNNIFYINYITKNFKYKILYLDKLYITYFKSDEKNISLYNIFINDFIDLFYIYLSSLSQKRLDLYFKKNLYLLKII